MEDFNWVKELSACSLRKVFEELKLQVEADVETRQALRQKTEFGFACGFDIALAPDSFKVLLTSNQAPQAVKFTLKETSIAVSDTNGDLMFEATLTLNDEGECRVKINGVERKLWHLRRMALESLFFGICAR